MRSKPENKLSPAAIKAWRLSTAFVCLIIGIIPLLFWMYNVVSPGGEDFSIWMIAVVAFLIVIGSGLFITYLPEIRWQHWYYQVDKHEIDLQHGIFIITRTLVPVKRVQHVDTRQGPILRNYGLADVTISTAATTHRIPALDEETADKVRNQISRFARLAKEDV